MKNVKPIPALENNQNEKSTVFNLRGNLFDVDPLLKVIDDDIDAANIAKSLDSVMEKYFRLMCESEVSSPPGLHDANHMFTLRLLRNAFLKGAGIIDMEE